MAKILTYSFLDVSAAIVGPGLVTDLGAGSSSDKEGISVTFNGNVNTMDIGADGRGQHSLSADRSGTVTVRLLRMSSINAVLMAAANYQRSSAKYHGQNTISITDKVKGDIVIAQVCAFQKIPNLSFGEAAGVVEWIFESIEIQPALGNGV